MPDPTKEILENRRAMWADAARADPLMALRRRCYNTFHAADLADGQIASCYVGLGYLLIPGIQDSFKPNGCILSMM